MKYYTIVSSVITILFHSGNFSIDNIRNISERTERFSYRTSFTKIINHKCSGQYKLVGCAHCIFLPQLKLMEILY